MSDSFAARRHRIAALHVREAAEEIDSVAAAVLPGGEAYRMTQAILLMINALHEAINEELT